MSATASLSSCLNTPNDIGVMEQEIIDWIKSVCDADSALVQLGIGDDAAILETPPTTVWTTDMIAEGTHFDLNQVELSKVGRKAMAVNLSDLAAMGASPAAALVTLQLPSHFTLEQVQCLYQGLLELSTRYQFPIVGGDTNRWNGPLLVSIALMGTPFDDSGTTTRLWNMSGGNPDDAIFVSGCFGGSLFHHHYEFEPQIQLAEHLALHHPITAATDSSDSLTLDLAHLARSSTTGFEIDSRLIPIAPDAFKRSESTGLPALHHALYDGEDFQLICSVPPDCVEVLQQDTRLPVAFTRIGRLTASREFTMIDPQGVAQRLEIRGYEH